MLVDGFKVNSPNVVYNESEIISSYVYNDTEVEVNEAGETVVKPISRDYQFRTETKVPRVGVLIVGWGGNNGSTLTAGIIANRENLTWRTKEGEQTPDYMGSVTQCSTLRLGRNKSGKDVWVPFNKILPMVNPNDLVLGGWDISSFSLDKAMERAAVLDYDIQRKVAPFMEGMVPMPAIYDQDFIAANQADRADNVIKGTKQEQMEQIRKDIRAFKSSNNVDKVIVLWSANTERFSELRDGLNDTADNVLAAVERNESENAPSTLYAIASILEGSTFINGSPQNTLVPGVVELAQKHKVYIGGDDFKTGQTKLKSVLVDFLVSAGIKPVSIVSYNHLGNNDGKNLSAPQQFRSKEISKSTVVDDMVEANKILYPDGKGPDHCIVIKYVPHVGDSKRAMDEYTSRIFMGGHNTIAIHNTCEDSLLATPLMVDLIVIAEMAERITWKTKEMESFERFHSVLSLMSYMLKAPMVPQGTPVVNALARQRANMENIFRACVGLPPENQMRLEDITA